MYPQYPTEVRVTGGLMGRTLGYLALFLAVVFITSVFGVGMGRAGFWIGLVALFGGTLMVNRSVARSSGALLWGIVVSGGMGLVAGPVVWAYAVHDPQVVMTALVTLVLAVALCAALVSWIPWDFSRLAPLMMVGLIMLVAAGFLSLLIPGLTGVVSSPLYSLIGVAVFTGYLLVDFSLLRRRRIPLAGDGVAVLFATIIMVDLVNLFLFLLMLGRRR